jgi:homoserine dehydrogenase
MAERDPTADVEGHDAAAKAAILAALAFGSDVVDADVHREGITAISAADVAYANRLGYSVKLWPSPNWSTAAPRSPSGCTRPWCPRPTRWLRCAARSTPSSSRARSAVSSCSTGAGPAAGRPRAPCWATWSTPRATCEPAPRPRRRSAPASPCAQQPELRSAFYLSMDVADRPGVLAAVAKVFGTHQVSIRAMEQVGLADEARLIFLTHVAREGDLLATIDELRLLQAVDRVSGVLRVIGEEEG